MFGNEWWRGGQRPRNKVNSFFCPSDEWWHARSQHLSPTTFSHKSYQVLSSQCGQSIVGTRLGIMQQTWSDDGPPVQLATTPTLHLVTLAKGAHIFLNDQIFCLDNGGAILILPFNDKKKFWNGEHMMVINNIDIIYMLISANGSPTQHTKHIKN